PAFLPSRRSPLAAVRRLPRTGKQMQPQSLARTVIGLLQGIGLYFLYLSSETKSWPATDGLVFAPLVVSAIFVPLVVIAALGHLRPRVLVGWTIVALATCVSLAFYDIFRDPTLTQPDAVRILPRLWLPLGAALFITHALITASETDRR